MRYFLFKSVLITAVLTTLAVLAVGANYYVMCQWDAAQTAVKENRIEDAKKSLWYCQHFWFRSVPVRVQAARAARLEGDFEAAEKYLKEATKLAKGSTPEIQVEYLLMRVQRGEEDVVAGELFQYVDGEYAEWALILETLARAYMRNLRYGPAFTCLSVWIQKDPDAAQPYQWRGWVLERLNDWGGAMKDYERALELNPEETNIRLRLAEILLEHAKMEEAVPHLELLWKQHPDRPDVKARLGQCRVIQGLPDEARDLLEDAVKEMPDDSSVLLNLARLELGDKHPEKAEPYLRHALKVDPTDMQALFELYGCLQQTGRQVEAQVVLQQHQKGTAMLKRLSKLIQDEAEKPTNNPDNLHEIGVQFLRSGNARVGVYWLRRALQIDPNHQATHKALADYYEGKGDKERAAEHRRQLRPVK
jgi:tetratricopeptide (TPR) repeat protein